MKDADLRQQVGLIREVFTYAERFRGATFVIKIADAIIEHSNFLEHIGDLALLQKAGIRIVIVPSAQTRIDEILSRFGIRSRFENGIRISDPESIELIKMAAFDVAHRVITALSGHRISAVIGNWVRARARGVIEGVDFLRTGVVDRLQVGEVSQIQDKGTVVIFPCVGHNDIGLPYNLSSEELTISIARALHAAKIFHLGAYPVMSHPDWTIPKDFKYLDDGRIFRVTAKGARELFALNPNKPSREVLGYSAEACEGGITRIHILDGRQPGVLIKEIFSNLGVGTMVFADDYERIRPMESSDITGVLGIMNPLVEKKVLVRRTREELESIKKDFIVYAMDGVVHGCAALHIHQEACAEIAGVSVDPHYAQLGIGAKLVSHLLGKATAMGMSRVFVLTTQTTDWFLAMGFKEASLTDLPASKSRAYNSARNSRILIKSL